MNVNQIMTAKVITIGMDDTLGQIQNLFKKYKFHHVLVLDDEELIGVISDRDVLKEISPYVNTLSEDFRARKTLTKKAHQIMTRNPITVEPDVPVENAASIMLNKKFLVFRSSLLQEILKGSCPGKIFSLSTYKGNELIKKIVNFSCKKNKLNSKISSLKSNYIFLVRKNRQ